MYYSAYYLVRASVSLTIIFTILYLHSCSEKIDDIEPENSYLHIPDNQFETLLIEQHIDSDGLVNQQILSSDAMGVTHLDLDRSGSDEQINELTGLEGFINLTFLSASSHLIEEIDLSQNTLLYTLLLRDNYLTTIDLSNNPNLVLVDLQVNELTSIHGVSKLNKLKKLDLSWNFLEELTFENASIEVLLVNNNQLSSYEVEGASSLESLLLTTNRLATIDLSSHTSLQTLILSDNHIRMIDLSQNALLSYLRISSNSLVHLDVSDNPNLVELRADRNPNLTCIRIGEGQDIPSLSLSECQHIGIQCD